ncbi:MAG: hypothetical protein U1E76_01500 [Planctomycetota bacterium]
MNGILLGGGWLRSVLVVTAAVAAAVVLIGGCSSSSSSSGVTVSASDVSGLSDSTTTTDDINESVLSEIPDSIDGTPSAWSGNTCASVNTSSSGDDFSGTVTLTNCERDTDEFGTVSITGSFAFTGSAKPASGDVTALKNLCKSSFTDLDALLADAGDLKFLVSLDGEFTVKDSGGNKLFEIQDAMSDIAAYEKDVLSHATWVRPFTASSTKVYEVHGALCLDQPVDAGSPDVLYPFGLVTLEYTLSGSDRVLETVTFVFDGTKTVTFETDHSNQSGTIDLETGDVSFD